MIRSTDNALGVEQVGRVRDRRQAPHNAPVPWVRAPLPLLELPPLLLLLMLLQPLLPGSLDLFDENRLWLIVIIIGVDEEDHSSRLNDVHLPTRSAEGGCRFSSAEAPPLRPMSAGLDVWKPFVVGCGGGGGRGAACYDIEVRGDEYPCSTDRCHPHLI